MPVNVNPDFSEVFISYASADRERVLPIADQLAAAGVSVWLDTYKIEGAARWAEEIVRGIKSCKVFLLMCSDAAMRSWAVKQELQLAGECQKRLLPLILRQTNFPDQMRFFLAGWQWIEVLDHPTEEWLPCVLRALQRAEVSCHLPGSCLSTVDKVVETVSLEWSWEGLRALARLTDQIWPMPANSNQRRVTRGVTRGLGAPQDEVQRIYRLRDRIWLAIESDREGHLLLLDEGPEGIIYCLCPSHFAPEARLQPGRNLLPQREARYDSFVVTGKPGREHLLAVITDEPLGLDLIQDHPSGPARVLNQTDISALLTRLRQLEADRWTALSAYFDVVA
jgi:TIR domain-containing protein/uncharacterized protein DUF4384